MTKTITTTRDTTSISSTEFARLRKVVGRHCTPWCRAHGLTAEARTVQALCLRSNRFEPWSWTEAVSMDRMADEFGLSRRSLFYHLRKLQDVGLLKVTVRHSKSMRIKGTEYPVYVIDARFPYELESWSSNKSRESAILALTECNSCTLAEVLLTPQTPSPDWDRGSPNHSQVVLEEQGRVPTEVGRRRKRRLVTLTDVVIQEDDVKRLKGTIGAAPEEPGVGGYKVTKEGKPSARLGVHFEKEWDRMRMLRPDLTLKTPQKPWHHGGKTWFYKWTNETLLPACGDDEQLAARVITLFCEQVRTRKLRVPPNTSGASPVFSHFGRSLDVLIAKASQVASSEPSSTEAFIERQRVRRERASAREAASRASVPPAPKRKTTP